MHSYNRVIEITKTNKRLDNRISALKSEGYCVWQFPSNGKINDVFCDGLSYHIVIASRTEKTEGRLGVVELKSTTDLRKLKLKKLYTKNQN